MSEHAAEAVNEAGESYNQARQDIAAVLNDPEPAPGALSSSAFQAEEAHVEYDRAVAEYEAEATALEAGL